MDKRELFDRQKWSLNQKIDHTLGVVEQFHNHFKGKIYVAFSGGKDSTVLLHLVRRIFPDTPAVFADTGLEYPEIREFCQNTDNVTFVKPKKSFKWVLDNHGYPVISKKISMGVNRFRNTSSPVQKNLRLWGGINPTSGKKQHPTVSKKWHYLVDAPFDISEKCCDVLKKDPLRRFEKESGLKPIIGAMAEESAARTIEYLKTGCNAFEKKHPQSTPMMFWTEKDVWEYLIRFEIPYSRIYDMGYERTGCMFCLFGIVNDKKGNNRFQRMKSTHPKQYAYCIDKLKLGGVMDYLGVEYV